MKILKHESTLWDLLAALAVRRGRILLCVVFSVVFASIYLFITPTIYKAECRILPMSQGNNATASIAAQLGSLGGLAGMTLSTTSDLLIGVMQGDEVVDRIVDRFDLMTLYKQKSRLKIQERVRGSILHLKTDVKSGIVFVSVLEKDPQRAADMANAFVEELKNKLQFMSVGEAAQRRVFFEEQMKISRLGLEKAEDDLVKYQEDSGVLADEPQAAAILNALAALRAQIMAKEVEISSLRTWAKKDNPALRQSQAELETLKNEMQRLERRGKMEAAEAKTVSSLQQLPSAGLEYQRKLRAVKYEVAMYDLMLKQWSAAKLDEAKEALRVQVLDPATPPDYKFKPKRATILLLSAFLGLSLGMLWALGGYAVEKAEEDEGERKAIARLKAALRWRKR